jgi:hypothetical protein
VRVKKGLYVFGPEASRGPYSPATLANQIYGPSANALSTTAPGIPLSRPALLHLLHERIDRTDFGAARRDVRRFVKDPASLDLWSASFFREVVAGVGVV